MAGIPENLMARLHEATERFHQARLFLDDLDSMDQAKRQSGAATLRAAQKELDEVTQEIHAFLSEPGPPGG
jgi:hypothetical protein